LAYSRGTSGLALAPRRYARHTAIGITALLALSAAGCGSGGSSRKPATPVSQIDGKHPAGASAPPLVLRASVSGWRLPAPVYRTVAVALAQRILVLGGHETEEGTISDVYELDTANGKSRTLGSLALPTHGAAAALLDGRVLVFGGASTSVHDVVQQFDPVSRKARVIGHLPTVRADVTAAVAGKMVVLSGGFDGVEPQRDVWATSDGRTFRVIARLPQAVRYPAVVPDGQNVYVFGGLISGGEYNGRFSNFVQRVSVHDQAARIVGRLPTPLAHAMGALLGSRILVLGGSTPAGPSAAILRFDPARGRVSRVGHLPHPLTDGAVATIADSAYLLGGISTRPLAGVIAVRLTSPSVPTPRSRGANPAPR
jgi:N-acetylneuraminic acid mutarotase